MTGGAHGPLSQEEKRALLRELLQRKGPTGAPDGGAAPGSGGRSASEVPERFHRIERFPALQEVEIQRRMAETVGIPNPFFRVHDGVVGATTQVEGRSLVNFSAYNYLGLSGHPRVNAAVEAALHRWGSSAGASRVVSGERSVHLELEEALARFLGVEAAVVFVSGHATNVTTIGHLLGPRDLVLHDQLIHNSALVGARLSGAHRRSFRHNDWEEVDTFLTRHRKEYEKVLIVVEGLYSMDGDVPPLPRFVELRARHGALLMVDEAHALGVLGAEGRGVGEHFGVPGQEVDLWMGTLSKTLASQGGYIAGSRALVDYLKFTAPGFVYSVGMSPPLAAAALEALRMLEEEPGRVRRLRERGARFLEEAKGAGLDTGLSAGYAVVPVIVGSSLAAARASAHLFEAGFNVSPIIHPAVPERAARLRFFLSAEHEEEQLQAAVRETVRALSAE